MVNWLFGLKCPDCGARFKENDKYCPNCGTDLDAANGKLAKVVAQQYLSKAQQAYDRGIRLKAALSYCNLTIQYDPYSSDAYNLRGLILDAMGKIDEAINSYQEAIHLNPNFEEARENLEDAEIERRREPLKGKGDSLQEDNWPKIIFGTAYIIVVVIALASSYFLYTLGRQFLGPKTTIIFEPDRSQMSAANPVDLEKTAQLLTERSHFLGYTQVSFIVSQNDQIIGKVPSYVDAVSLARRIKVIGLLEFVDFGKTRVSEGTSVRTDLDHRYLMHLGGTQWHTVMTNDEIETVNVSKDEFGSYAVDFTLTAKGKEIFRQYTTENVGSYLGIVWIKLLFQLQW
jgi:hypothetical protein